MILQLLELIVRIVKTMILSSFYVLIIYVILLKIYHNTKNGWIENRFKYRIRNCVLLHFLISLGLFAYSFSYWEDTGLGEAPQLPIGFNQVIYSPDFEWTEFYPNLEKVEINTDELIIGSYCVKANFLCAEVPHDYSNSPEFNFIVYDLAQQTMKTFGSKIEYNEFAQKNSLPKTSEFYEFKHHYQVFFDNKPLWKKWLLP